MVSENKKYIREKFELDHLSDLEIDFLISEVTRLFNKKKKGKPVTDDIRKKVIELHKMGINRREIANQVDYSLSTIDNIINAARS